MSSVSFNPYSGSAGRTQTDRAGRTESRQTEKPQTAASSWSSEAGSVSFSTERYARADAYGRSGQTYQSGRAEQTSKSFQSVRPSIVDHDDYGKVIGEPQLSEKASEYYKQLKSKFGNLDFVLVGKDSLSAAKANASSYGNANHLVVLIDEEKLERMATDENFRKKYEAIIAQAQSGGSKLNSVAAMNPNIKKIGINVNDNGAGSFMAACAKNNAGVSERVAKKREEKKAQKKADEKKAAKKHSEEARQARIEKRHADERKLREELSKHPDGESFNMKQEDLPRDMRRRFDEYAAQMNGKSVISEDGFDEYLNNDDYEIIYANSMDELISKLEEYNNRTGFGASAQSAGRYMDYQA